jgi:predicted nucleotide-binding protein (sugar kinase/HSP70/actin superfamily)
MNNKKTEIKQPRFIKNEQWPGYQNPLWHKNNRKDVTILYNVVEKKKSYFLQAFFRRNGYKYIDLGDHVKEDVRWGKEHGNRMQCNPTYFTSGSLVRNLMKLHTENGLSKEEIVKKYIFLGGGGQCGPCRYGMYPQEYLKVINDAGFKNFRILIFSSDISADPNAKLSAFPFNLMFKINFLIAIILADFIHIAECALLPYVKDRALVEKTIAEVEEDFLKAFTSRFYLATIPLALKRARKKFASLTKDTIQLPLVYITGEFFANLSNNDGNYHLRKFISDEGCEAIPGSFTQRTLYDNWRRSREAIRGITYAASAKERAFWKKSLRKQNVSTNIIKLFYNSAVTFFNPSSFGGRSHLIDLDHFADLAKDFYHPEIFGGEGNLEIAEAIYFSDKVEGFISIKPFGCMPSSGVSDGVQTKIMSMYPELNFLSIETSGDNEVNILSRVSMLLFKAKEKVAKRNQA